MQHSRASRMGKERALRRKRLALFGGVGVAALAVAALLLINAVGANRPSILADRASAVPTATRTPSRSAAPRSGATTAEPDGSASGAADITETPSTYLAYATPASGESTLAEVPDVGGRRVSDAVAILEAAGLTCATESDRGAAVTNASPSTLKSWRVGSQDPGPGAIVTAGARVTLTVAQAASAKVTSLATRRPVVCIDPGHQSHGNNGKEPIGPGSSTKKAKVAGGATGVKTRIPEYEIALQIAMNLKSRLQKAGVKVVMTRTSDDVDISNAERAKLANRAKADLFVRIHANGSPSSRQAGLSVLYPAVTKWTKSTSASSRRAAIAVQQSTLYATGASSDGLHARSDLAGFNWCTQPAILIECGYLSNPVEDRLLASPNYQDKLAAGMARGILGWLGR